MKALHRMDRYRKEVLQLSTRKHGINVQYLYDTQYTCGGNLFVPDFNRLPFSLCSQGDKNMELDLCMLGLTKLCVYLITTKTGVL